MLKKLWKQLRSDWIRVCMALLFASLIYLLRSDVFSTEKKSREFTNIPVKLSFADPKMVNLGDKKYTVSITVEGSAQRINELTPDKFDVNVVINSTHFVDGLVKITEKNIECPIGINIKEIKPNNIAVNLDTIESKKVKVLPTCNEQNLSADYAVEKIILFPDEVMISGPASKIKNITSVKTNEIPLDDSVPEFSYVVDFPAQQDITITPSKVNCQVVIFQKSKRKVLKNVPVSILTANNNKQNFEFTLAPSTVQIEISGPYLRVNSASAQDFEIFVDVSNIATPGVYQLPILGMPKSKDLKIHSLTPLQLQLTAKQKNQ